jgi:GT2 family glycosyltransferase
LCFRAIKAGFKIMYFPRKAIHLESETKKKVPDFNSKIHKSKDELMRRYNTPEFRKLIVDYPISRNEIFNYGD